MPQGEANLGLQRLLAISVFVAIVILTAVAVTRRADEADLAGQAVPQDNFDVVESPGEEETVESSSVDVPKRVRVFEGLDNVDNTIFALGWVWAVTSNLPDHFSPGDTDASLIRVDPMTGESEVLLNGLGVQPRIASLGDRVWAKLEDRIVAFDASGVEAISFAWELSGDMFVGERYLWVTDFRGSQVSAVDPATGDVVRTLATGRFPVAPIVAFGHAWIPSATDGTVSIFDEATLGETTNRSVLVTEEMQTYVTAIPGGATGAEVWVTNIEGELFAIGAQIETFGELRQIPVDRPVFQLVPQGDRIVLIPLWGHSVLIADLATGEVLAEIPIDSIPYLAVADGDRVWITSDGPMEALTQIDLRKLSLVEQFQIGTNESNTTGPKQPFVVGDEIWVPNRGDDAIFAVSTS